MSTLVVHDGYRLSCSTQAHCSSIPWEARVPAGKQWQRALSACGCILSASAQQFLKRITLTLSFPLLQGGFMTREVAVLFNCPSAPTSLDKDAHLLTTHAASLSPRLQIHQEEAHCWRPGFRSEVLPMDQSPERFDPLADGLIKRQKKAKQWALQMWEQIALYSHCPNFTHVQCFDGFEAIF